MEIFKNRWVAYGAVLAAIIIVLWLLLTFTDLAAALAQPGALLNLAIIFLVVVGAVYFYKNGALVMRPDPFDLLAKACKTPAMRLKGISFEKIDLDRTTWELGQNCYWFDIVLIDSNSHQQFIIQFFPQLVVSDHALRFEKKPKAQKLGSFSVEDFVEELEEIRKRKELEKDMAT